jgi:cardiolipin synthase
LGALAHAQQHVRISTPYLILDAGVMTAVNLAAMSGVTVDIILSDDVDLALIKWASRAMLWQVLERGVRVWRTPPPFNHSKVMTIDGGWTLVGSSNWDPRSLRLNFEFDVECYDAGLAQKMERLLDARIAKARRITLQEMDSRPLPVRFRDGVARLASPFL